MWCVLSFLALFQRNGLFSIMSYEIAKRNRVENLSYEFRAL
jgi:hypothetical protein